MSFKLFEKNENQIIISIILGIGLAGAFRKICNRGNCIIVTAPSKDELTSNTYRMKDKCFKYISRVKKCTDKNKKVKFA